MEIDDPEEKAALRKSSTMRRQPDVGRFLNCIFMLARISGSAKGSKGPRRRKEFIIPKTGISLSRVRG